MFLFKKFLRFFQIFIGMKCNFNSKDDNGYSPLHLSVKLNNYAAAINLLSISTVDINVNFIFF